MGALKPASDHLGHLEGTLVHSRVALPGVSISGNNCCLSIVALEVPPVDNGVIT